MHIFQRIPFHVKLYAGMILLVLVSIASALSVSARPQTAPIPQARTPSKARETPWKRR